MINSKNRKLNRKEQRAKELENSDIVARIVGRDDIEYGEHTELPQGENVAFLGRLEALKRDGTRADEAAQVLVRYYEEHCPPPDPKEVAELTMKADSERQRPRYQPKGKK